MFLIRLKAGEHKFIRKCLLRPQSESAEEWFSGPAHNKKKEGLRDCTGFTFETWKIQLFFFYIQSVERNSNRNSHSDYHQ